jgi:predicted O-methyltransferase YrrM
MLKGNAIGVEFGVARGYFSESLLRSGRFTRLYSVDKWNDHHNDEEHSAVVTRLAPFGGQSQVVRLSFAEALTTIANGSLDFIYVDGYAHTGHDADIVRLCLCKLKPGALVAVHDYDEFSWPLNHRRLSALFSDSVFTDRYTIPPVLTLNNEDIFPGAVARFGIQGAE